MIIQSKKIVPMREGKRDEHSSWCNQHMLYNLRTFLGVRSLGGEYRMWYMVTAVNQSLTYQALQPSVERNPCPTLYTLPLYRQPHLGRHSPGPRGGT